MPHGALQMDPDALCKLWEDYERSAWMPASLFDSLGFCKDFTLHPSLGSNTIDLVCPLSLSLKETLSRRPSPPFPVVSIILTWQREQEWSVLLKKINAKTVAVMRWALQFTTLSFSCFLLHTSPLPSFVQCVGHLGFCFALRQRSVMFPVDFSGVGAATQVPVVQKLIYTLNF